MLATLILTCFSFIYKGYIITITQCNHLDYEVYFLEKPLPSVYPKLQPQILFSLTSLDMIGFNLLRACHEDD